MGRLLRRAWRYLVAMLSGKLDQAIEDAKQQPALLSQQAAAVIGNERELQLKLTRAVEETEKLQANARQALLLAEQARDAGAQAKAASYQASAQARAAVETNALALQKKIAERTKLLSQLDQAKMQEQLNRAMAGMTELAAPGDTPSLDEVRDKIEGRYARALGEAELQSTSIEARMLQVERASIDAEGAARLESIREGLGLPSPPAIPEVEPSKKAPSNGS